MSKQPIVTQAHIRVLNEVGNHSKFFGVPLHCITDSDPQDVKFCIKHGLLQKERSLSDRRKNVYSVSAKGRAAVLAYVTDALNRQAFDALCNYPLSESDKNPAKSL